MQLSPIFFGILLTILSLLSYCVVRILWKRSHQHKADDVTDSSKQSSSLLCTSVVGNTNGTANIGNANHTDTITKVGVFFRAQRQLFDCCTVFYIHSFDNDRTKQVYSNSGMGIQISGIRLTCTQTMHLPMFAFMRASLVVLHVFFFFQNTIIYTCLQNIFSSFVVCTM